ncbi:MAG: hypothetical protein ACTFAK_00150 [Candidatus Electronema sp. VV]
MKLTGRVAGLLAFLLLNTTLAFAYCFFNASGHGPDLLDRTAWFMPTLIIGLLNVRLRHRAVGLSCITLAALGIVFMLAAVPMGIMLHYDVWTEAGMPQPTPLRIPIILTCAALSLLALAIPYSRAASRRPD